MNTKKAVRVKNEIEHFTNLEHIWWGARTVAGQKRYDDKARIYKKFCQPSFNSRILEIGCGDGEFTKRIAKFGGYIMASDVTPEVLKRGRIKNRFKNVKFVTANAESLDYPRESFDIVCGVSILHHINIQKAIRELYRVLRKGGKLFFTEPNLLNPNIFVGHNISWLRKKMEYSPDETALIRWQVDKLLRDAGFREVKVENYDFLHPLTPAPMVSTIRTLSNFLEKIPLIKEISGSLIIYAEK